MLTNYYMSQTGMHSDTYFTGKTYAKLDAYVRNSEGEIVYVCSSNQYKTQRRFKESLRERHSLAEGANLIIKRGS